MEIWDNGVYELLEEKANGQLTFVLSGKRLQGTWSLVPAHLDGNERNWLLIKVAERSGDEAEPRERGPARTYSPMLASPHEGIPAGDDWVYEVKFDGFRTIAYVRHGECKLLSRNDKDLTERFAEVAKEVVKATKSPNAVLDGELCRLDATGRASFSELQQGSGAVVLYAFDLLELDGVPLIDLPLTERKSRLQAAPRPGQPRGAPVGGLRRRRSTARRGPRAGARGHRRQAPVVAVPPGQADQRLAEDQASAPPGVRRRGLHAGRGSSRRELRRARSRGAARKARCVTSATSVPASTTPRSKRLLGLLRPLHRDSSPFAELPKLPRLRLADIQWVEPQLVAEVRFTEWTHDARLRHPSYLGLRDDKAAAEVKREAPIASVLRRGKRELRLSNLDKPFWSDPEITKGDLLSYYQAVAPVLVPHLKNRPVHDAPLPGRLPRQGVLPEERAQPHAGLDSDLPHARHDA